MNGVPGSRSCRQAFHELPKRQIPDERHTAAHAASCHAPSTTATMSRMMAVMSKSFGV